MTPIRVHALYIYQTRLQVLIQSDQEGARKIQSRKEGSIQAYMSQDG